MAKKFYENIIIQFRCLLKIVFNQGIHLVNDVIKQLLDTFISKHQTLTIYYLQENGLTKPTNKTLINMIC